MNSQLFETGLPEGVTWRPKMVRNAGAKAGARKKEMTLAEMNQHLSATRDRRLAAAEANSLKMTGKPNL